MGLTMWRALAVAAAIAAIARADDAVTSPLMDMPDYYAKSSMVLSITAPDNAGVPLQYNVIPLTEQAGLNGSVVLRRSIVVRGTVLNADATSYPNVTSKTSVAYVCCDAMPMDASNIDTNFVLNQIMNNQPRAILLYSQNGTCCGFQQRLTNPFGTVYTMSDAEEAAQVLNITNSGNGIVQATITGNATTPLQQDDGSGGNNSAVAMSILYSITGLITLLFLVIIATGAIRAHRYPERYGPRSGYGGRPRQSRAKGIARAVLETLPIIKFGESTPPKPDPALELESASTHQEHIVGTRLSAIPESPRTPQVTKIPETVPEVNETAVAGTDLTKNAHKRGESASTHSREADEHLGCSICTEDFSVGEDVRVLPCDHKFHPQCVDPWLINVSGTCPLCRLDLHPQGEGNESPALDDENSQLPPPLEEEHVESGRSNRQSRRASRLLDLHRLRHASVQERIEILRRHRSQQQEVATMPEEAEHEEHGHGAGLSARLKERFRIRTRTQTRTQTPPADMQSA